MALYGHDILSESTLENINLAPFTEMMAYLDLSRRDSASIKQFCMSEAADILLEKQVLKKPTLMRLSKEDDKKRRIKLCAYRLAKEDGNPNWKKMIFHRAQWRKYRDIVVNKYYSRAVKLAVLSQKDYIKRAAKASTNDAVDEIIK